MLVCGGYPWWITLLRFLFNVLGVFLVDFLICEFPASEDEHHNRARRARTKWSGEEGRHLFMIFLSTRLSISSTLIFCRTTMITLPILCPLFSEAKKSMYVVPVLPLSVPFSL